MKRATAVVMTVLGVGWVTARPAAMEKGVVKFFNESKFTVHIPDAPRASKNIREVAIDELNIDIREMTTGLDVEYRLYGPGQAHWGNASFTSACTLGGSKELQRWWQEAARGRNIRKNITVTLFSSVASSTRSYTLVNARPVSFSECDPASPDPVQTLVVRPGRIEVDAPGESQPLGKPLNGFHADIQTPDGRINPDDTWELVVGGASSREDPPLALGLITDPTLDLHAHQTCTDVTLRGAMTDSRHALAGWINDTVSGRDWRRLLTISQDGGAGAVSVQHVFTGGFPVAYVFPHLDVRSQNVAHEEIRIKPIRCELK